MDFAKDLARAREQHVDLLDTFVEAQARHLQQLAEWCADTLLGGAEVALAVVVPGPETARIQEVQLFAGHLLCRWVERLVLKDPAERGSGADEATISAES